MKTRNKTADTAEIGPPETLVAIQKRRIFLVDDHPVTRQGVTVLINQESNLTVCGEADAAPKALELIQKLKPDLAVIDISLKTTSGIELMKDVKAVMPELPMLVMSMHDESLYAERALRAGAKGYIMKQEASEKILTAINCLLGGELYLSDKIKDKMVYRMLDHKKSEAVFPIESLSDREFDVFRLIGNGYSSREIAETLNLSIKTIDSYRENLKLKLRLQNSSQLVRHAIQWAKNENIN